MGYGRTAAYEGGGMSMTNTHHDILEAARKGEVGKAANCGYYGARPQTILHKTAAHL